MTWDPTRLVLISASSQLEAAIGERIRKAIVANLPASDLYTLQLEFRQDDPQAALKSSAALGLDGMIYRADLAEWRSLLRVIF
jgi:hypothetical protein